MSCTRCRTVALLPDLADVGPTLECGECHAANPTFLACRSCRLQEGFEAAPADGPGARPSQFACPMCGARVEAAAAGCPACGADFLVVERPRRAAKVRPRRRVRGEYEEASIAELARLPGVGRAHAEELCRAGYAAPWKVQAATEEDLAKIRGVGPGGAKAIKDSLGIVMLPRRRTTEAPLAQEYVCPLCGCVTSLYAIRCHDCSLLFEDEGIDESLRTELERDRERAELAFYEVRLMEDQGDADVWYARGHLFRDMGELPDAITSFDRALALVPNAPRVRLARAAIFAELREIGKAAAGFQVAVSGQLPEPDETLDVPRSRSSRR